MTTVSRQTALCGIIGSALAIAGFFLPWIAEYATKTTSRSLALSFDVSGWQIATGSFFTAGMASIGPLASLSTFALLSMTLCASIVVLAVSALSLRRPTSRPLAASWLSVSVVGLLTALWPAFYVIAPHLPNRSGIPYADYLDYGYGLTLLGYIGMVGGGIMAIASGSWSARSTVGGRAAGVTSIAGGALTFVGFVLPWISPLGLISLTGWSFLTGTITAQNQVSLPVPLALTYDGVYGLTLIVAIYAIIVGVMRLLGKGSLLLASMQISGALVGFSLLLVSFPFTYFYYFGQPLGIGAFLVAMGYIAIIGGAIVDFAPTGQAASHGAGRAIALTGMVGAALALAGFFLPWSNFQLGNDTRNGWWFATNLSRLLAGYGTGNPSAFSFSMLAEFMILSLPLLVAAFTLIVSVARLAGKSDRGLLAAWQVAGALISLSLMIAWLNYFGFGNVGPVLLIIGFAGILASALATLTTNRTPEPEAVGQIATGVTRAAFAGGMISVIGGALVITSFFLPLTPTQSQSSWQYVVNSYQFWLAHHQPIGDVLWQVVAQCLTLLVGIFALITGVLSLSRVRAIVLSALMVSVTAIGLMWISPVALSINIANLAHFPAVNYGLVVVIAGLMLALAGGMADFSQNLQPPGAPHGDPALIARR